MLAVSFFPALASRCFSSLGIGKLFGMGSVGMISEEPDSGFAFSGENGVEDTTDEMMFVEYFAAVERMVGARNTVRPGNFQKEQEARSSSIVSPGKAEEDSNGRGREGDGGARKKEE